MATKEAIQKIKDYQRSYREKNRERLSAKNKKRYYDNHERIRKLRNEAYWNNREKMTRIRRAYMKEYTRRLREETFAAYGNKCNCCGETIPTFLEIDHIKNNGGHHRKEIKGYLYRWLKRNGFPKDDFQLLCSNCNKGKYLNGGTCPHKTMRGVKCLKFPIAQIA